MASVRYEQATRIYAGTEAPAVDALDLTIGDGEFLVMVGPSGPGRRRRCACSRGSKRWMPARSSSATEK